MKNSTEDLHNMLMEQMENIRSASADELPLEIQRGKAMSDVAGKIIDNSRVVLEVAKLRFENCPIEGNEIPKYLNG